MSDHSGAPVDPAGLKSRVFDVAKESLNVLPPLKRWLKNVPVSSIEESSKDFESFIPDLQDDVQVCKRNAFILLKQSM